MPLSLILISTCLLAILSIGLGTATDTMYVFAYSWTPEFCYGTAYPGCDAPKSNGYWKDHFTVHGLWPQYTTSGYPADCTTEAFNATIVRDSVGIMDLTTYWPNVQSTLLSSDYTSFWEHEWTKHGTCSGLSQADYFKTTIDLVKKYGTPSSLTAAAGGSISASTLREEMGGAQFVALQCTDGQYLNGAYTCWAQSNGYPTALAACPADVISEDTCTASTLQVATF